MIHQSVLLIKNNKLNESLPKISFPIETAAPAIEFAAFESTLNQLLWLEINNFVCSSLSKKIVGSLKNLENFEPKNIWTKSLRF